MTTTIPETGEARFLSACRSEPADATPVWFMRQAGRCLADYRALRERYDILTLAKTPDLCSQVTLMPVETFGVDAAVMFADIMLPLEGMGVSLEIQPDIGPIIHNPIRNAGDVIRLRPFHAEEQVPYVLQAIRQVRSELQGGRAAVVGFSGSPFTLACYLVEGRPTRDYGRAKSLMFGEPDVWATLMDRLARMVADYLKAQIQAGAQVVQVFDSWVGILNPQDFERFVLPWSRQIFQELRGLVPTIYFGTGASSLLERMASAGSDIMSVDWRVNLDDAWERIGFDRGIQGNMDPVRPLAGWNATEEAMRDILARAGGRPGHVFNLGHGVLPETDPALLARLVDAVHTATAR